MKWYNWNIVESDAKHHNHNSNPITILHHNINVSLQEMFFNRLREISKYENIGKKWIDETGVPGENLRPAASTRQTLSHEWDLN
jgi:hypothetical protein